MEDKAEVVESGANGFHPQNDDGVWDLRSEQNVWDGYEKVSKILSKKTFGPNEVAFSVGCGVVAAVAGFYNFQFGKEYVYSVAKRWNFTEQQADLFSTFCGTDGLLINLAINAKSIKHASSVVKDEIIKKNPNAKSMPDDNFIRMYTVMMVVLSIIGAIPNLKFVYDTTKSSNPAYLIFMEIIQFITVSALNFRGLYNTLSINTEKKQVVTKFKLDRLQNLNKCLKVVDQISQSDLIALSEGKLERPRAVALQKALKFFFGVYVIGYSAAFFFTVRGALPDSHTGTFVDDIVKFLMMSCGLLSSGLKLFFLSNAYSNLTEEVFNVYFQSPILKIDNKEVRQGVFSRNAERLLYAACLAFAIFSLGSSSKIVEKYFFDEKTTETFWISLFIGGGAALGINAIDLANITKILAEFGAFLFKAKVRPPRDPNEHFGMTHKEFIYKCMLKTSKETNANFLSTNIIESRRDVSVAILENELQHIDPNYKEDPSIKPDEKSKAYLHGYYPNTFFNAINQGCRMLWNVVPNRDFGIFKSKCAVNVNADVEPAEGNYNQPYSPLLVSRTKAYGSNA